jgi:GT2 family glycosyltransferase
MMGSLAPVGREKSASQYGRSFAAFKVSDFVVVPGPRLSIVIPTRHRPGAIARCLQAIADGELDRAEYEVIVVLDGEDVANPAVPDGLPVRVLRARRGGPAVARNRGAGAARGDVLAFTDDDCAPAPGWARRLLDGVETRPDALVGGRFVNALPDNGWAEASHLVLDVVVEQTVRRRKAIAFVPSANMALRRDVFRAIGGFDERFSHAAAEDRDLCARLAEAGHPIVLVPEAVVHHHHDLSATDFWRQHAAYGAGAVTYQRVRRDRGQATALAPGAVYRELAAAGLRHGQLARVAASQLAYATGLASGLLRRTG